PSISSSPHLSPFPTRRSSDLLRVGVLASGRGSNLQALLDAGARADYPARVVVVVSDREDARALARARAAGVSSLFVNPKDHGDRDRKSTRLNSSHVAISYAVF